MIYIHIVTHTLARLVRVATGARRRRLPRGALKQFQRGRVHATRREACTPQISPWRHSCEYTGWTRSHAPGQASPSLAAVEEAATRMTAEWASRSARTGMHVSSADGRQIARGRVSDLQVGSSGTSVSQAGLQAHA